MVKLKSRRREATRLLADIVCHLKSVFLSVHSGSRSTYGNVLHFGHFHHCPPLPLNQQTRGGLRQSTVADDNYSYYFPSSWRTACKSYLKLTKIWFSLFQQKSRRFLFASSSSSSYPTISQPLQLFTVAAGGDAHGNGTRDVGADGNGNRSNGEAACIYHSHMQHCCSSSPSAASASTTSYSTATLAASAYSSIKLDYCSYSNVTSDCSYQYSVWPSYVPKPQPPPPLPLHQSSRQQKLQQPCQRQHDDFQFPVSASTAVTNGTTANSTIISIVDDKQNDVDEAEVGVTVTYIGHSTFLLQTTKRNILINPTFFYRAGPFGILGPRRVTQPGVAFEELPNVDLVLLSSSGYEALDKVAIKRLVERDGSLIVCGRGLGRYLSTSVGGSGSGGLRDALGGAAFGILLGAGEITAENRRDYYNFSPAAGATFGGALGGGLGGVAAAASGALGGMLGAKLGLIGSFSGGLIGGTLGGLIFCGGGMAGGNSGRIYSLDYFQGFSLDGVQILFTPAVHTSGRLPLRLDANLSLSGGFILRMAERCIYFSGFSAYGPHFTLIRHHLRKLLRSFGELSKDHPHYSHFQLQPDDEGEGDATGWLRNPRKQEYQVLQYADTKQNMAMIDRGEICEPIVAEQRNDLDLALLPIGAYRPIFYMKNYNMTPYEAVRAHLDLQSSYSIAFGFDTFPIGYENFGEAPTYLKAAKTNLLSNPECFEVLSPGESRVI